MCFARRFTTLDKTLIKTSDRIETSDRIWRDKPHFYRWIYHLRVYNSGVLVIVISSKNIRDWLDVTLLLKYLVYN